MSNHLLVGRKELDINKVSLTYLQYLLLQKVTGQQWQSL